MSKIKELERENKRLKKQLEKFAWIPVDSETKPKEYQYILVSYYDAKSGQTFMLFTFYFGKFDSLDSLTPVAWMPAPAPYTPPNESVKDGREE